MKKVAIIGAGVSGLGCGVRIKEKFPDWEITIVSKDFTPNTTGDGSAGLWTPYLISGTPSEKLLKWGGDTYRLFFSLWREGIAGSCMIPCMRVNRERVETPAWKDAVFGYRELEGDEMEYWKSTLSLDFNHAMHFVTFTCEPPLLLDYLTKRFIDSGGKFVQREVENLDDFVKEDFDVIINCTGLNAKCIVPDSSMHPIRGQVARVKTPWMYHCLLDDSDDGNYIIPNTETCILGGTHQVGDFNTNVDPADSKFIFDGCQAMIPGLKNFQQVFEWVGLRPGRNSVRLEMERRFVSSVGKSKIIIHNYGHGGSGVTLFWGCAAEVVDILSECIDKEKRPSKL